MSSSNTKRLILCVTLCLTSLIDAIIIGMRTMGVKFVEDAESSAFPIYPTPSESPRTLGQIPLHLFPLQPTFTFGLSIAVFLMNIVGAIMVFVLWLKDVKMYDARPILVLKWCLTVTPCFIMISVLLTFVQHTQSSHFDIRYISALYGGYGPKRQYEPGVFDLETWVCDLAVFDNISPVLVQGFGTRCEIELVARWLLVPWLISSLLVAGATWYFVRDENARSKQVLKLKVLERLQYV
ncbi:hypothetical protein EJ08DRAFT_733892 [Tothia fuscella]|uniref:Uncharacterized protein n=1 Tax=Tothia fuscella TaxID=1048955 RepID=A0A9P4TZG3_9PEZI|nr:hypothetical protein EJ08DRAFT_733892 [Tothia fuscella]